MLLFWSRTPDPESQEEATKEQPPETKPEKVHCKIIFRFWSGEQ